MGEIPTLDSLLEVTVTPLYILLTMECSTRFILRKVQVVTKHYPIVRLGLECNTWVWYCISTYSVREPLTHNSRVTLQLIKYYYIIFSLTSIVPSTLHCLLAHFHCSDPGYQMQGCEDTVIYIM